MEMYGEKIPLLTTLESLRKSLEKHQEILDTMLFYLVEVVFVGCFCCFFSCRNDPQGMFDFLFVIVVHRSRLNFVIF